MLAQMLYDKIKEKFQFFVSYNDEYYIFEHLSKGASAIFIIPTQDDFLIRMDVADGRIILRITLQNSSKYMDLIDGMPENIKKSFRCNDCKGCQGVNCSYCMVYTFEGTDYRQCHFIGAEFSSVDDVGNFFALICAEHGM